MGGDERGSGAPNRRTVLAGSAGLALAGTAASAAQAPVPIIDSHIHLFGLNRPLGTPWSGPPGSEVHKVGASPEYYEKLVRPLGVVGAVCVEASPWVEDNLWVLQVMERAPMIVAFVANFDIMNPAFGEYLARHAKSPLVRGVRYGNIFNYDLAANHATPVGRAGLKAIADAGLLLEVANPNMKLLEAVVRISDALPNLPIIIDHLPNFRPQPAEGAAFEATLRTLAQRPQVCVKLSEIVRRENGALITDIERYRPDLDRLYETFGEDRVIFGSDWPNSDSLSPIEAVFSVAKAYFASKTRAQQEKYFWRNSARIYKWAKRAPDQPSI